jgi:DNA-binding NtrC family response regulator
MNHEKVLIVEDEENERTGLAELITGWGYRAETAKDGAEGLEKVTSWAPSIVVTDMKMPGMSGLELLEKLAIDAQTMAVVVVTAQGTIDSAVQAMRMGAYDYITKPIDTTGCGPSCKTPPRCWGPGLNSRSRAASCAMPVLSEA